ncbi:MAG: exodeoxyribonuclease VII small subunit [Fretibacterium sp.]|nr:exodeoxyribonuclease VII small subunit [Fretibacterium sp.]
MSFGRNLERLDEVLKQLESEPISLDEALDVFEQGVSLVRENRELLMRAEQRVKILTREGEEPYDGTQIAGENEN